jgi:hypothetical protein
MKFKGQSAVEFLVLVGAVFFVFVVLIAAVQFNIKDKVVERNNIEVNEIARAVQDEINLAVVSSSGYYRKFDIPTKIVNREFKVNITGSVVYVRTDDGKYAVALPVADVNGDVRKGVNVIRKEGEEVYLNE